MVNTSQFTRLTRLILAYHRRCDRISNSSPSLLLRSPSFGGHARPHYHAFDPLPRGERGNFRLVIKSQVQGGPLSPLLSNLVLDELDKELERRGLEFCRYADDCNIFVRTRKAADRIMGSITTFIEKKLKLKVNNEKSKTGPSHKVKFLGMTIIKKTIAISKDALAQAMQKVKELTPRGTHLTLEETIKKINQWYLGWSIYFMMTQYPAQLKKIEAHIRRRLRRRIISQHKRKRFLFRKLCQRGVNKGSVARTVYGNRKWWALSHTQATEKAYPNKWFIESLGQHICSDQEKSHWFDERVWIALT